MTPIVIQLTPKQLKQLKPLFDAVDKAAAAAIEQERGAVLAQVYGAGQHSRYSKSALCYFLDVPQSVAVRRAIKRTKVGKA